MNTLQKENIKLMRGKGESYARIAAELKISENTVKSYCRRNNLGVITAIPEPKYEPSVCGNCGKPLEYTQGAKRKRFCSDFCRMFWWRIHPEAVNRKAVYQFNCVVCNLPFESYGNAQRKYCSRECYGVSRRAVK